MSRGSGPRASPISPARADSLTLNDSVGGVGKRERIHSDLSSVAESDRSHLRQLGEASISMDGDVDGDGYHRGMPTPEIMVERTGDGEGGREFKGDGERPMIVSPLTPPQGMGDVRQGYFGPDSVGAVIDKGSGAEVTQSGASETVTRRRSNFEETLDE